ncbi:unnamed protein product, partial [Musa hybrid cultivar]
LPVLLALHHLSSLGAVDVLRPVVFHPKPNLWVPPLAIISRGQLVESYSKLWANLIM